MKKPEPEFVIVPFETTVKATRVVSQCSTCGQQFEHRHEWFTHYRDTHLPQPIKVEGVDTYYKFEQEEQAIMWLTDYGYDRVQWTGPGWYGASDEPEKDDDGDDITVWRHTSALDGELLEQGRQIIRRLRELRGLA